MAFRPLSSGHLFIISKNRNLYSYIITVRFFQIFENKLPWSCREQSRQHKRTTSPRKIQSEKLCHCMGRQWCAGHGVSVQAMPHCCLHIRQHISNLGSWKCTWKEFGEPTADAAHEEVYIACLAKMSSAKITIIWLCHTKRTHYRRRKWAQLYLRNVGAIRSMSCIRLCFHFFFQFVLDLIYLFFLLLPLHMYVRTWSDQYNFGLCVLTFSRTSKTLKLVSNEPGTWRPFNADHFLSIVARQSSYAEVLQITLFQISEKLRAILHTHVYPSLLIKHIPFR